MRSRELRRAVDPEYYRDRKIEFMPLNKLMSDVWRIRPLEGTLDPYAVLAEMPIPLYVTTQPWNLLAEALRTEGKDPQAVPLEAARGRQLVGRCVRARHPGLGVRRT